VVRVTAGGGDRTVATTRTAAPEAIERHFRDRFEQAPLPQVLLSLDGRLVRVNDATCQLLGRPAKALHGVTTRELSHPSDTGVGDQALAELLEFRRDSGTWERIVSGRDGSPVPLLVHCALLREPDGTPYGVAGFAQDVTVLRQAERARGLMVERTRQMSRLSSREHEIVSPLLGGDRVPAIAEALFITQSTVRNHLSAVFQKLGVHSQQVSGPIEGEPGTGRVCRVASDRWDGV